MQAILTKYLPPTNNRCSRIKASCERGYITLSYPHEGNQDQAHRTVALALVNKFADEDVIKYPDMKREKNPWLTPFASGVLPSGDYAHVFIR